VEADNWMKDGTLGKRINSTAAVLALVGKMNQVPQNPKELFTSEFIAEAAKNTQNLIQNVQAFNPGNNMTSLRYAAEEISKFLVESGLIKQAPNLNQIFDDRFIKAYAAKQKS
jgi:hypothetical protein